MRVIVERIQVPANSTLGFGTGYEASDPNRAIEFTGDHRPMRIIGEAINAGEIPVAEVEDFFVQSDTCKGCNLNTDDHKLGCKTK